MRRRRGLLLLLLVLLRGLRLVPHLDGDLPLVHRAEAVSDGRVKGLHQHFPLVHVATFDHFGGVSPFSEFFF